MRTLERRIQGPFRKRPSATALLLVLISALCGCPTVPINSKDTTPPTLHLGSVGLNWPIDIDQSATQALSRRATRGGSIALVAQGGDNESGVAAVSFSGTQTIACIPGAPAKNIIIISDPISVQSTPTGADLPVSLIATYQLTVAPQIARCPASSRFSELTVTLNTTTTNGAGLKQQLPQVQLRAFGPDQLRVATLNLNNPGNWPDSVFTHWGTGLGSVADVLLLTEVRDRRTAQLLADAAGMAYLVTYQDNYFTDVAIVSRYPLRDVQRAMVTAGPLASNSYIVSATADIDLAAHQFIVNHWATRDANDVVIEPNLSNQARVNAAAKLLSLLSTDPSVPSFVGGDLNAFASTPEVMMLTSDGLVNSSSTTGTNKGTCTDRIVDFILSRGPVAASIYDGCESDIGRPSDHPLVIATFVPN